MKNYLPAIRRRLVALPRCLKGKPPTSTVTRLAYSVPRQQVLITARHDGTDNVWPIDWHMRLSNVPPIYGICAYRTGHGAQLVRDSGVFVVNFVPATWEDIIMYCGRTSGRDTDKFAGAGLRKEEAESVDAPRLADSLGALECKVQQSIDVGISTLFIADVTHSILRSDAPRPHYLDKRLVPNAADWEALPKSDEAGSGANQQGT